MNFLQNLSSVKSTTICAAKVVLLIIGAIYAVILFKAVIIPYTSIFIFSTFPSLMVSVKSWMSIPFLYIIVNCIIVSIAVSSNFHSKRKNRKSTDVTEGTFMESTLHSGVRENIDNPMEKAKAFEKSDINPLPVTCNRENPRKIANEEHDPEQERSSSALSCRKSDMIPVVKNVTGDSVSLDSSENCDDMESTWQAIMEREGKQATLKLKKSETWPEKTKPEPLHKTQVVEDNDHVAWARRELRKLDTFNDTSSLKRDQSMSPEELYRQAEAFIQKVNNQMRLQRLESDQRLMEMVKLGI